MTTFNFINPSQLGSQFQDISTSLTGKLASINTSMTSSENMAGSIISKQIFTVDQTAAYQTQTQADAMIQYADIEEFRNSKDVNNISLQDKTDVIANIRIIQQVINDNSPVKDMIPRYTRMFIESMSTSKNEYYQLIKTFDSFKTFFFGSQPQIARFQGTLFNAINQDWYNDFVYNYTNYMSGTKCVEQNAKAYIQLEDELFEGYIIDPVFNKNAMNSKGVPFSFTMIVTYQTPLNPEIVALRNRVTTDPKANKKDASSRWDSLPPTLKKVVQQFFTTGNTCGIGG